VTVIGAGFPAEVRVRLYLGVPGAAANPQAHVEGTTDPNGRFGLAFVMPGEWPGGRAITENKLVILATTDDFNAQATAEFDYAAPALPPTQPPPPQPIPAPSVLPINYPQNAQKVTSSFLKSLQGDPSGNSSLIYLSHKLQDQVRGGRTVLQLVGIQTIYQAFTLDGAETGASGSASLQVTLNLGPEAQSRIFLLAQEDGAWRISAIAAGPSVTVGDIGKVTNDFLLASLTDPSGESSQKYLSRRLAAEVQKGRSLLDLLGIQSMYTSFAYEVIGASQTRVTLNYANASPQVRTFTLIQEGGWRIDAIAP
jgi:hypothetical protein